jgi:hypothetical protein
MKEVDNTIVLIHITIPLKPLVYYHKHIPRIFVAHPGNFKKVEHSSLKYAHVAN